MAVVEWNRDACDTLQANQSLTHWPTVAPTDVYEFSYSRFEDKIDLLAGGPPCQPFSLGGKHRGHTDNRNLFPEVFRAVRELRPRALMIENVKGLLRSSFENYAEFIRLQLSHPTVLPRSGETWREHLPRLERHHTKGKYKDLHYNVVMRLLNAADFGVPQRRERVFFVGFRNDLGIEWAFPDATHSRNRLLFDQWVSGEYWERHGLSKAKRGNPARRLWPTLDRLTPMFPPNTKPWLTVRDALVGLPNPRSRSAKHISNHVFIDGARTYKGHTGSPLDEPAKTLKAGDHGVPGGENMVALPDGKVRYFTVRESARLQTFPDEFVFKGSWGETMRQLGNAVPVTLAEFVAKNIRLKLENRHQD